MALDVAQLVGKLVIDDDLMPRQEQKVLSFVRFALLVAVVG